MKKTVVEYITNTLEDIPKQSLQTNKRRLHAFFSEQETIEKRGHILYSGMLSILLKNYEDLRNKASLKNIKCCVLT